MGPAFRIGSFWVVILKPLIEIVLGFGELEEGNCVGAGLLAETKAEPPFGAISSGGTQNMRVRVIAAA